MDEPFDDQVGGVAALDNRTTARAYRAVVEHGNAGRDLVAAELGIARSVAAFHLDKLVDAGLLDATFERTSGRTGPGAGRPAKLYRRSPREIQVSVPPRRYDLAGSVLAGAVARSISRGVPVAEALAEVARERGREVAGDALRRGDTGPNGLLDLLSRSGFAPRARGGGVALLNCPFHALAEEQRHLVCRMNLDFLSGVLDAYDPGGLAARLAPEEGSCCVRLDPQGA